MGRSTGAARETKRPTAIDVHVGARLRARRLLVGMSQERLGEAIGLTFQQIQKYESGKNRIGASRMHQIAGALGVEVGYFYEGAESGEGSAAKPAADERSSVLTRAMADILTVRLVEAFAALPDPAMRRNIVDLVETLAAREARDSTAAAA